MKLLKLLKAAEAQEAPEAAALCKKTAETECQIEVNAPSPYGTINPAGGITSTQKTAETLSVPQSYSGSCFHEV